MSRRSARASHPAARPRTDRAARARRLVASAVIGAVVATFAINTAAASSAAPPPSAGASAGASTAQGDSQRNTVISSTDNVAAVAGIEALPPECTNGDRTVTCTFVGTHDVAFRLPLGASNITYQMGGSAGLGAVFQTVGGQGGVISGSLGDSSAGRTLYIGTAAIGADNTMRRYGDFNGGSAGCSAPYQGQYCGGRGGAATVLGIDNHLVAVAGGGGGAGSDSFATRRDCSSCDYTYTHQVWGVAGKSARDGDNVYRANRGDGSMVPTGGDGGDSAHGGGGGGGGAGYPAGVGPEGCRTTAPGVCPGPAGNAGASWTVNGGRTFAENNGDSYPGKRAGWLSITWTKNGSRPTFGASYTPVSSVYAYADPRPIPIELSATQAVNGVVERFAGNGTYALAIGGTKGEAPGPGVTPGFSGCSIQLVDGKGTCVFGGDHFPLPGNFVINQSYSGDKWFQASGSGYTLQVLPDPVKTSFTSRKNADGTYTITAVAAPGIDKGVVDGTLSLTSSSSKLNDRLAANCPARTAPAASVEQRGVSLTLECTLAVPPGTYPIKVNYAAGTASAATSSDATLTADKFAPSVALSLTRTVLNEPGATTTASVVVTRSAVATDSPKGTVRIAPTTGTAPGCDATLVSSDSLSATYSCDLTPPTGTVDYVATFNGDDTFVAGTSAPVSVTTVKGTANLVVTPSATTVGAGDKLDLAIKVTDPAGNNATAGLVKVYDGTPVADDSNLVGTLDLAGNPGGGTVSVRPGADVLSHTYTVRFTDPTFQLGSESATTIPIKVTPMRGSVDVSVAQDGEQRLSGVPVKVTATVTVDSADTIDADIVMPTGATSCTPVQRTTSGSDRLMTRSCTFDVPPGGNPTYTVTYSDRLVGSLLGTGSSFTAPASSTTTTVGSIGTVNYGVSPVLTATVVPTVSGTPVRGVLSFTEGSTTLCSIETATSLGTGLASGSCAPSTPPTAGSHDITATFTPDAETPTLTAVSQGRGSFSISKESVAVALTTARVGDRLSLLATTAAGAGTPNDPTATGAIAFGGAGSSCGSVDLVGGVAACSIPMPKPGETATATASYRPSANFVGGSRSTADLTYTAPQSGSCTSGYAALVAKMIDGGYGHSITLDAGQLGSAKLTADARISSCDSASSVTATGDVELFGGTLVASGVAVTITQDEGLCLTSGSLSLPAVWKAGRLQITEAVCFPLTASGGLSRPSTGALALATGQSGQLPLLNIPGVTGPASLSARFGTSCGTAAVGAATCEKPTPAVTFTATTAPQSESVPGVTALLTVGPGGKLAGALTTTPMQIFGTSVAFAGSVSRTSSEDPLEANLKATLAADASPTDGLNIKKGATITIDGANTPASRYSVAGTAVVAPDSGNPVEVAVTGTFTSAQDYAVTLTTTVAKAWSPASGLTITPNLTGKLTRTGGQTSWQVTATGASGSPLAVWNAGAGMTVTVDQLSIGADATKIDKGCTFKGQVAALSGSVTWGDVTVPTTGCFAIGETGWHLSATSAKAEVSSVTLSDVAIDVTKPKDGDISLKGSANVAITVGGSTVSTKVDIIRKKKGALVVSGNFDGTGIGIPGNAYVVYSTDDIPDWDTRNKAIGTAGKVKLKAGVTIYASVTLPTSVASTLADANITLAPGSVVTLEAAFPKGADGLTVKATLATPAQMPVLKLPGDSTVDSLELTYGKGTYGLTAKGKISGQDGVLAPAELDLSFTSSKKFSGTAKVTGLTLLGTKVDLTGSVKRADGVTTSTVTGKLAAPVSVSSDVTLDKVSVSLGSDGLKASGDVLFTGTTAQFTANFVNTKTFSLAVSANVSDWTPVSGVNVNAKIAGSLARTEKGWTYSIGATPLSGTSFATIDAGGGVTIGLNSLTVSNDKVPATCKLTDVKDSWIAASATVSVNNSSVAGSATGTGCYDVKSSAFSLSANIPTLNFGGVGGRVRTAETVISVNRTAAGKYTASGRARLFVAMPKGGEFSSVIGVTLTKDGFAVGGVADLSAFYDGRSKAHLYYASTKMDVDTGDATLGTLSLEPGVTIGVDAEVSPTASKALNHFGIPVAAGSKLAATAHLDFESSALKLRIRLDFKPTEVFSTSSGEKLTAQKLYLQLVLSATQPSLGIQMEGNLHLPPSTPGGEASNVSVSGGITIGTELRAHLSVANWTNAFGQEGLTVKEMTIQGGITLVGVPLPSLAVSATVTGLPKKWAETIGYRQGAPLSLALALSGNSFLLDIKIGTKGSQEVVLQPFAEEGKPGLLQVNYAQLYISPTGATIGNTTYPSGLSLAFVGKIGGVDVSIEAKVDPIKLSLYFKGTVGKIRFGSLTLGPTSLTIDVSPSKFQVDFSGRLELGPTSGTILSVFRYNIEKVQAELDLSVGTKGISARASLSVHGTVGERIIPKWSALLSGSSPFQWEDYRVDFDVRDVGFSIDGNGVKVRLSGREVSLSWPSPSKLFGRPELETTHRVIHAKRELRPGDIPGPNDPRTIAAVAALDGARGTGVAEDGTGRLRVEPSMAQARAGASSVRLDDGRVLVVGGFDHTTVLRSAEIYDPATRTWSSTGAMKVGRGQPALVKLKDGRVIAVGGEAEGLKKDLRSAEVYNPRSGTWKRTASMRHARVDEATELLPDGSVLVTGGFDGKKVRRDTEIWNPRTGTWRTGTPMPAPRGDAAVAPLPGGDLLVAGGFDAHHRPMASALRYDGRTHRWHAVAKLNAAQADSRAVRLDDGSILVAGDEDHAEVYDPKHDRWHLTGALPFPVIEASLVALQNGDALLIGGESTLGATDEVLEYDVRHNRWVRETSLELPNRLLTATTLRSGDVLIAGGEDGMTPHDSVYVFQP